MKLTKIALACSLVLTLAACGGGGSSSSADAGGGTVVAATRTLEGVAAKGLIKNGIVKVYTVDAAGVKSATPLVSSRTSSVDGSYSVNLGSTIGLFTIEVSADAATTMADEFSGDIPMPAGFTLRSLVQLDSTASSTIKGHVTPFTEMLVNAAASATGGLTVANVADARSGVVKLLGFDPLTTKPLNINSDSAGSSTDASEKLQSVMLAAISKIANDSTNGFSCAGTVSEKIRCVVNATSGTAVLKGGNFEISLDAQVAVRDAADSVAANTTINKSTLKSLDGINGFSQSSVNTGSTVVNPIAAAKSFFSSIRTNLSMLVNTEKTGALNLQANGVRADFTAAISPVDQDLSNWVLMTDRAIAYFKYAKQNPTVASSALIPVYQSIKHQGIEVGRCFLFSDAAATILANNGAEALNVGCRLNKQPVQSSYTATTRKIYTKGITLTPVADSLTSYTYSARSRLEDQTFTRNSDNSVNQNSVVVGASVTIGLPATGTIAYTTSGGVADTVVIAGDMPARTTTNGVSITDKETWNVSIARTLEADNATTRFGLSGDITAIKAGAPVGSFALKPGSYVRAVMAGDSFAAQGLKEVNLVLAVGGASSSATGTLSMTNFSLDGSGLSYAPTELRFVGSFTNAGAEFFSGTLTAKTANYAQYQSSLPDSETNFLKGSAAFVGVFKAPSHADLSVSLAGSDIAFGLVAYSGRFDDGVNTILIDTTSAVPSVIKLTSSSGISLVLNGNANLGDVYKNSSKVATLDRSSGTISYSDGSFQSLK
ncbi:hypothetical protein [Actimicrobium antarcticum]|uniref:Uncharacterized protein n=1 Tax=Actimicrobium antarcticum TaxID=1051899 RepID=A0ABP7SWA3_9BURK